ncbi:MAG: hypothetical protein KatS3mg008_1218 [Acidimicrobiales bacterium]|nr:MAG: hypothetical protein KatS3mg008_1218 [Acidimicrobiales bacterium]
MNESNVPEKLRLLLVEDDPNDIHIIVQQLQQADVCEYTLQTAHTAADAEAVLARDESIDCVVLDLRLPDSDGIATVERIHARAPDTPIIVLTGRDEKDLALDAIQAGAQDFLLKGVVRGNSILRCARWAVARARAASAKPAVDRWSTGGPILDRLRVPAVHVDPQLSIRCANKLFVDLVGFSEDEIAGAAFTDLLAVDDLVSLALELRAVVRGEAETWQGVVGLVKRGGVVTRRRMTVLGVSPPEGDRAELLVLVDPGEA